MILKRLKKYAFIAACLLVANNAVAQDLLASQAPIDRKMRAVDSVMMQQLINNETREELLAAELDADEYDYFGEVKALTPSTLPDTFRISLKGACMPTKNTTVTSNFGARWGRLHKGLDIKVNTGDAIYAAFDGIVRTVRYEPRGYGKYVVIQHGKSLETVYGHLSKQLVRVGQMVRAGECIGLGGNTGRSTGSHLHFEVRLHNVALNPAIMFDFKQNDVVADEWLFCRSTYDKESSQATRLRGTGGVYRGGDGLYASVSPKSGKGGKRQSAQGARYHKVQKGETLSTIARKHHTTVASICKLSGISKTKILKPGQIVKY